MNAYDTINEQFEFMKNVYIECDTGWYQIIFDLCTDIQNVYSDLEMEPDIIVDQVKEKYGSLQFDFYFKGGYAEKEYQTIIGEIVNAYENKSDTICERCGKTGELRERNGWFSVLCDDCFNLGDF